MEIHVVIAQELGVKPHQVEAAITLLDEGNTVPFIARYRKEVTGELKDEQLRDIEERMKYLRNLLQRKEEVRKSIEEQGKLTEELSLAITKAMKLQELEDLYLPFRPKKLVRPWPETGVWNRWHRHCLQRLQKKSYVKWEQSTLMKRCLLWKMPYKGRWIL